MSDVSQGPGWWQASDGKWYPPQQAPGGAPAGGGFAGGAPAGGAATGAYAEWGTRVVATLIDFGFIVAIYIVGLIIILILSAISNALGFLFALVVYLFAIVVSFYFAYLTGQTGQSPGKRLMGIKVISEETGQPIGGGMGIVRQIVHFVDGIICYIGYLFPLWDPKKQTIADKILKTVSVTGAEKQSFGPNLFK